MNERKGWERGKASDEGRSARPAFGLGLKVVGHEPDKEEVEDLTKEFLAESQEGLERMELCLTELEKRPDDGELVAEIFRAVHTIKGTTGFLGFGRLEKLAHAGESLLGELRDGKLAVSTELVNGLLELMDGLRRILQTIEATGTEGERSTDNDDALLARLAELKVGGGELRANVDPASLPQDSGQPALPAAVAGVATVAGPSMQDKTLRIDVEVLNRMMNLVGELVLTRNQILRCSPGAENFPELARKLDSVTAELRENVMQARMQPVGYLFRKFPRMVRDLAAMCGRQVRIEFEGQETGLDKSLLEAVRDPLTHAVRNAVDHGIEPPEERAKAGKPAEGVVRMRAYHQSGSVVIEVSDDGARVGDAGAGGFDAPARGAAVDLCVGLFHGEAGDQRLRARHGDGCGAHECGEGGRKRGAGVANWVGNDGANAGPADAGDRSGAGASERRTEFRTPAERTG